MAKRFLTHIDLVGNQLINASFEKLTADPSTGLFEGRMYYNTTSDAIKIYDGTAWAGLGEIVSISGTTNEVDVDVVDGVATISLPTNIHVDVTGSLTGNADTATNADYATSAGSATTAGSATNADYATSAGNATTADSATYATSAGSATTADSATNADYATTAGSATTASSATNADYATSAGNATTADSATTAGTANAVAANSVALGTDTTGDYVASLTAGTGIGIDVTSGEGSTPTISNNGVLSVNGTTNEIDVDVTTGDVTISFPSAVTFPGTVTLNADPTTSLGAATKQYVDTVAEGLNVHPAVYVATTANIADLENPPASIDGVTLTDEMRVLVKNQSTTSQNGIYVYDLATTALIRASDYDIASEIDPGDFFFVTAGSTQATTGWVQTATVVTVGSDAIAFTQFSGTGTYAAGNGLTLTGTSFSIDTGITVDVSTAQTLTNKTLTSPTVSGLYLSDNNIVIEGTTDTHETTLVFTDPTGDRTITFKDQTGTVAYTADITSAINALTTSDIEEGTNLYFTDERAQDAVGTILGSGLTYTDSVPSIGVNQGQMTTLVVTGASGNSYGIVGNSLYLDVVNPTVYNSEIELDIAAVETKLVTDGFTKKASGSVGNGTNTSFALSHNLGTRDVQVQVFDNATYDTVECDVVRTDTDTVTVSFATAPTTNAYRVVVVG